MNQTRLLKRTAIVFVFVSMTLVSLSGCDNKELKTCQQDNQMLSQQVAELQYQLSQADQAAMTQTPAVGEGTYLVAEGDTLWGIAKKQLGEGKRYKEILALNPNLTKDSNLSVGMTLRMPPR